MKKLPKRHDWHTPKEIIHLVEDVYGGTIDLDPATTHDNPVGATQYYTPTHNGLGKAWYGNVFCNPPYGRAVTGWVDKAYRQVVGGYLLPGEERHLHVNVILLLPSNTQTKWFKLLALYFPICFVTGRIKFINPDTGVPQGSPMHNSILCCVSQDKNVCHKFAETFSSIGVILNKD